MTYDAGRTALATLLEGAAITTPISKTIARVYTDPPSTIQDLPCLILYGSSGARDWIAHGSFTTAEDHTERVRLLVHDADLDRAAAIVRAFRAAVATLIATTPTLGDAVRITRLAWEEPSAFRYGAREDLVGIDFLVSFRVVNP